MTFKTSKQAYFAILAYIIGVVIYVTWSYNSEKTRLYQQIDIVLLSIIDGSLLYFQSYQLI